LDIVWFTLFGIGAYLLADRLLDLAERAAGRRFDYRSVYFFVILLSLALSGVWLIGLYTG
jgi:hypothetical protein